MKQLKTHHFTLVLKNVDETTPELEDSLYEAGCDDALINYRNGAVYLEFDRESKSLEEAVISAIKNVRSSMIEAEVASVAPENLVSEAEIAKRLNKSRQTVSLWIRGERRKGFPLPVMRLSEKSPLWHWNEVVAWLFANRIVDKKEMLESAMFFANINAALNDMDKKNKNIQRKLVKSICL